MRQGDVIAIFPKRDGLKAAVEVLRRLPKPTAVEARPPRLQLLLRAIG
jgi:hypothetical protein